jgi:arylsulfatase A-like enzyme
MTRALRRSPLSSPWPRSVWPRTACIAALLLLACSEASETPGPDGLSGQAATDQRSVLLICLDTVRADHMGFLGYTARDTTPAMDALAEHSIIFDDVTAAACWTKPSVPSFLTGCFPATHGVYEGSSKAAKGHETDVLDERVETLAEAFQSAGYATAGFLRNGQLAPGFGIDQGFETYDNGPYDARDIADKALAWLEQRDDEQPFFLYLHVLDAHWPFHVPDEVLLGFASQEHVDLIREGDWHAFMDAVHDGQRVLTPEEQDGILAIYDGCLRYIDDQLARVFDALGEDGRLNEMVVGVVADHGEEFLEHGRFGHGHGLYENLTRVGWMLQAPGVAPGHRSQPVSLIDLHPTVLSAAGVPPVGELLAVDRIRFPDRPAVLFAEHKSPSRYEQALREEDRKLVRAFRSTAAPLPTDALQLGTRWEAEFEVLADGSFHATQLKPRDEAPLDPVELRGVLEATASGGLAVAGLALEWTADTEIYGKAENAEALVVGIPVKVVGDLVDGRFHAQRVKVYAIEDRDSPEIRGPLARLEVSGGDARGEAMAAATAEVTAVAGTLWIGPIAVTFDAGTRFKGVPTSPRMHRDDVALILDGGAQASAAAGYSVDYRLYDLSRDPGETAPVEEVSSLADASPELRRLSDALDKIAASAGGRSVWSEAGSGLLDEELLNELRALGYVR